MLRTAEGCFKYSNISQVASVDYLQGFMFVSSLAHLKRIPSYLVAASPLLAPTEFLAWVANRPVYCEVLVRRHANQR